MRAYSFTNFMLNAVSQGIQPGHCLVDMTRAYANHNSIAGDTMADWADNHKTMICLNGGNYASILDIWATLQTLGPALNLPFGKFHEDEATLGGLMTCCAIVVPERIYTLAAVRGFDSGSFFDADGKLHVIEDEYTAQEIALAALTRSCPLAR